MRTIKILLFFLGLWSINLYAVSPWLFNGNYTKSIPDYINLSDNIHIIYGDDDPTSVATDAPRGSIYSRTAAGNTQLYIKTDDGLSTNWTVFNTGAVAGNTLDSAYDQGGAGVGKTITADAGAVDITGNIHVSDYVSTSGNLQVDGTATAGGLSSSGIASITTRVSTAEICNAAGGSCSTVDNILVDSDIDTELELETLLTDVSDILTESSVISGANVEDVFLRNDGDDTSSGIVTAAGLNTSGITSSTIRVSTGELCDENGENCSDPADNLSSNDLDTELELETQLTDVSDVLTESSIVSSANIVDEYLFNNADDTTTGTLTAAGFSTSGIVTSTTRVSTDQLCDENGLNCSDPADNLSSSDLDTEAELEAQITDVSDFLTESSIVSSANIVDEYLFNNADDTTTGTLTAAGLNTSGIVTATTRASTAEYCDENGENCSSVTQLADRNTLDEAYDEGGSGAGASITADSGALSVTGNLHVSDYISTSGQLNSDGLATVGGLSTTGIVTATTRLSSGEICDENGANCYDPADNLTESELDTEAELEAQITDVSDILTESSIVSSANIVDEYLFNNADDTTTGTLTAAGFSTSGIVTATTRTSSAEFCDENGENCGTASAFGTHNTLDQAYDQGGAGAGATITADSGALNIVGNIHASEYISATGDVNADGNLVGAGISTSGIASATTRVSTGELCDENGANCSDPADNLSSSDLDTEAELEAQLTDVSDVLTESSIVSGANVEDVFLRNDGDDSSSGIVTAAGLNTSGIVTGSIRGSFAEVCDENGANCSDPADSLNSSDLDTEAELEAQITDVSDFLTESSIVSSANIVDEYLFNNADDSTTGTLTAGGFNTSSIVTSTIRVSTGELCDENGANCSDPADNLSSSDLDTEAELEAQLTDVSDVLTESSIVSSANIVDEYLFNNADDTTTGTLTAAGFTTSAIVTGSTRGSFAELCDENGLNCSDISAGLGGGNTLDEAYDQGGAGSGAQITADSGAVDIVGNLHVSEYVSTSGNVDAGGMNTSGIVTGTTRISAAELCDENGANCNDVSAGFGGGASFHADPVDLLLLHGEIPNSAFVSATSISEGTSGTTGGYTIKPGSSVNLRGIVELDTNAVCQINTINDSTVECADVYDFSSYFENGDTVKIYRKDTIDGNDFYIDTGVEKTLTAASTSASNTMTLTLTTSDLVTDDVVFHSQQVTHSVSYVTPGSADSFSPATLQESSATDVRGDLKSSITSRYKLEETSGSFVDSVGSNDMTSTGTFTFGDGHHMPNSLSGMDGTNRWTNTNEYFKGLAESNFSVSMWFNPGTPGGSNRVIFGAFPEGTTAPGSETEGWGLWWDSGTTYRAYKNATDVSGALTIANSAWHHVVFTHNNSGNQSYIYIDGVQTDLGTSNNINAITGTGGLYMFNNGSGAGTVRFLNGLLEDIRVYDGAILSQDDVNKLYNDGLGSNGVYQLSSQLRFNSSGSGSVLKSGAEPGVISGSGAVTVTGHGVILGR